MDQFSSLTFSSNQLDRAAHLRDDPTLSDGAETIVLWRGRALMQGNVLARYPVGSHQMPAPAVFLGYAPTPVFATDVSSWAFEVEAGDLGPGRSSPDRAAHPGFPAGTGFADLRHEMARLDPMDAELWATARSLMEWHRSHAFCAACGQASAPDQWGWRRTCSACGRFHFPRTDPVVIMLVTRGNRALLGRSPGWPDGMYSLLAGFMEPGETIEAAVRREVFEESSIRCGDVRYLGCQPWAFPSSLMIGCHAQAESDDISLDPIELEDAIWVSREEAARIMAGQHPDIRPLRRGAIAEFLLSNWLADRLG